MHKCAGGCKKVAKCFGGLKKKAYLCTVKLKPMNMEQTRGTETLHFSRRHRNGEAERATIVTNGIQTRIYTLSECKPARTLRAAIATLEAGGWQIDPTIW